MAGCEYWVRKSTGFGQKLKAGIQCGKHTAGEKGTYCPKHELVIAHEADRFKRAGEASARARAFKREQEEALKASLLRAFNSAFIGKDDGR